MDSLASAHPQEVRALIRKGQWTEPTAGLANGYAQANLVILPQELAYEFLFEVPALCYIGYAYIPSVVGLDQGCAEFLIWLFWAEVGEVTEAYSDEVPEGAVISQSLCGSITTGGCVPFLGAISRQVVDLVVSLGPEPG